MKSTEEITELVTTQLAAIPDSELRERSTRLLRQPRTKILVWEYGDEEEFESWLIADMGERNVWAAYCEAGHGALGCPWGLVFKDSESFGMDAGWYRSLRELFEEWFAEAPRGL